MDICIDGTIIANANALVILLQAGLMIGEVFILTLH